MSLASKSINYLHAHPVCLSTLGIVPVVAQGKTLLTALTISLVFSAVLLLSAVSVAAIRNFIPHTYRLVYILAITSMWTTVADLLLQAYAYETSLSLTIYIPLLAMNSLILMLLEQQALKMPVVSMLKVVMHAVPALILVTLTTGAIRELLARGSLLTEMSTVKTAAFFPTLSLFNTAAGGFIVLGMVIALINYAWSRIGKSAAEH